MSAQHTGCQGLCMLCHLLDGVKFCRSPQMNRRYLQHTMKSLQRILMMVPFL